MEVGELHLSRMFGFVDGPGHGSEVVGARVDHCSQRQEMLDGGEVEGNGKGGEGSRVGRYGRKSEIGQRYMVGGMENEDAFPVKQNFSSVSILAVGWLPLRCIHIRSRKVKTSIRPSSTGTRICVSSVRSYHNAGPMYRCLANACKLTGNIGKPLVQLCGECWTGGRIPRTGVAGISDAHD